MIMLMHNQHPNPEQINPDLLEVSRAAEINERFQIAFHGVASKIHEVRQERALKTEARMEQKDRLYKGIGGAAIGAIPHGVLASKPKTFMEQRADRRLDRKAVKQATKANDEYLAKLRNSRDRNVGAVSAVEKKRQNVVIRNDTAHGRLTAAEARIATLKNEAAPADWTTATYDKSKKESAKAERKLLKSANKLADSKWRNMRKRRAGTRAVKAELKSAEHASKGTRIKNIRNERQLIKDHYAAVDNNEVYYGPTRP